MTIPDYQTLMRPALDLLSDGAVRFSREVKDAMAAEFDLSLQEREERLASGRQRVFDGRVGWALTYLAQAGLVERPVRGQVRITDRGRSVLAANPDRVDVKVLEQFEEFRAFRERTRTPASEGQNTQQGHAPAEGRTVTTDATTAATPNDLMQQAVDINRAAVEAEVLSEALRVSPTAFEDLVVQLLSNMGYGEAGSAERTSASGDAGIDGIISQDPLGLDRIYIQAKRYSEDRPVDRPRIHEFAGALLGKQGDRGVFITTSRFTTGAREEAERINARIELIDGHRLAGLLVHYGVGVQTEQTATLYRVDNDYFDTL